MPQDWKPILFSIPVLELGRAASVIQIQKGFHIPVFDFDFARRAIGSGPRDGLRPLRKRRF
jgi:hypothetical protein